MSKPQFFSYKCPHCSHESNAAEVAAKLPDEILRLAAARRNSRLRKVRSVGGGRPTLARCPGCSQEMTAIEMRDHRIPCVRGELKKLIGSEILLTPKDPDPYPIFYIQSLSDDATHVAFYKGSNRSVITVDLRKISGIIASEDRKSARVRLLGRVVWYPDLIPSRAHWAFEPTGTLGRPPREAAVLC